MLGHPWYASISLCHYVANKMTSSNGNIFRVTGLCAGNSPVTGEFPTQRPVTRRFDVFFDLRLNKRLSKQSWHWWFETPSCSLWRHCNGMNQPAPLWWLRMHWHQIDSQTSSTTMLTPLWPWCHMKNILLNWNRVFVTKQTMFQGCWQVGNASIYLLLVGLFSQGNNTLCRHIQC